MEKPYVKSLKTFKGLKVYLVDDAYIRNKMDVAFTDFGQHYTNKYIPKGEIWIGETQKKSEIPFFVREAYKKYTHYGKNKTSNNTRGIRKKQSEEKVRISLLGNHKGLKIYLVNGLAVRANHNTDYTLGGHGRVYDYIPENEIWLEKLEKHPGDELFNLVHEIHEWNLMGNENLSYEKAHKNANEVEGKVRHNPKMLDSVLRREFSKIRIR